MKIKEVPSKCHWEDRIYPAVLMFTLMLLIFPSKIWAQSRPRPLMHGNTIVTGDTLQPLRGVRWALDLYGIGPPSLAELMEIRANGCNTLHVYAEQFQICDKPFRGCPQPGCNETRLQTLVDRTRQAGLYMVIAVGGTNPVYNPIDPDCEETPEQIKANFRNFNYGFWNKYAPLHAEETHVIFEIQNEPYFEILWGSPSVGIAQPTQDWVIDLNAKAYQIIATHAPQTPVLLFSYAFLHDAQAVRTDLSRFEAAVGALPPSGQLGEQSLTSEKLTVNWDKVGVAFHGYFIDISDRDVPLDTIATLVAGPSIHLIETEGWSLQFHNMNVANIAAYEHHNISWLAFNEPFAPNYHPWDTMFRDLLDEPPDSQGGVIWVPDEGTWPALSDPPLGATVSLEFDLRGFVRVNPSNGRLIADANDTGTATKMTLVQGPTGGVLLKAELNGNYVTLADNCIDPDCESPMLQATATHPSMAEEFIWMTRQTDGQVAIRSTTNQNFVTADLNFEDPPALRVNRWRGGGIWSGFGLQIHETPGSPPGLVPNFLGTIDGTNIDGLVVETTSPLIEFTWDHAGSEEDLDFYEVVLQPVGGPWLYVENEAFPGQTLSIQTNGLEDGTSYSIHIRAWDVFGRPGPFGPNGGTFIIDLPETTQTPFLGQPYFVQPNTFTVIQGEDFDEGGETVAVHDTTPGNTAGHYRNQPGQDVDIVLTDNRYHLGFTDPGEWTEYTAQITPGIYDLEVWTATTIQGRRFFMALYDEFDTLLSSTETNPSVAPNTGDWGHFQKVVIPNLNLSGNLAGPRFLRLAHLDGLINVDRMVFRPHVTPFAGDGFGGHNQDDTLDGTPTDVGTKVWESHPGAIFAAPGSITNASTERPFGFVPFHPNEANGEAILLEADLNVNTSNHNDWLSLGFHTSPGSIWGGNGEIWLLIRRDGRYTVFCQATTYTLATGQVDLTARERAAPKRAVLRYWNGKVSVWINGIQVLTEGPIPAGFTPDIYYAGFTAHSNSLMTGEIFVDNFAINFE